MAIEVVSIEVVEPKVQAENVGEKNKGGRPKGRDYIDGKYHKVTMMFNLKTYEQLVKNAKKTNMPVSRYCAQRVIEAPEVLPIEQIKKLSNQVEYLQRTLSKIETHIAHIGGNINQAQKRFNEVMIVGRESKKVEVKQTKIDGVNVIGFRVWNKEYQKYEIWSDFEYSERYKELQELQVKIHETINALNNTTKEIKK
jgi:uncharacterized protein (DUF608 family)